MITNIRKLRSSTKEILHSLDRGNNITITNRGKPCAKIVPYSDSKQNPQTKNDPAFGMWKSNKKVKSVKKFVNNLRANRHAR